MQDIFFQNFAFLIMLPAYPKQAIWVKRELLSDKLISSGKGIPLPAFLIYG
jgi:hypothetical protein